MCTSVRVLIRTTTYEYDMDSGTNVYYPYLAQPRAIRRSHHCARDTLSLISRLPSLVAVHGDIWRHEPDFPSYIVATLISPWRFSATRGVLAPLDIPLSPPAPNPALLSA